MGLVPDRHIDAELELGRLRSEIMEKEQEIDRLQAQVAKLTQTLNEIHDYPAHSYAEYTKSVVAISGQALANTDTSRYKAMQAVVAAATEWHSATSEKYGGHSIELHPAAKALHDSVDALERLDGIKEASE